jgi:hypothetical protein
MRIRLSLAILLASALVGSASAAPKCTRLGFSVNDYGKDGPTKDAKDLLDKHIAKWAAENNIAKYEVGKKDVNCELFLDLILFDEHTCRAEANVCWNEGPASKKPAPGGKAAAAPVAKPIETGTVPAPAAPAKVIVPPSPAPAASAPAPAKE